MGLASFPDPPLASFTPPKNSYDRSGSHEAVLDWIGNVGMVPLEPLPTKKLEIGYVKYE